MFQREEKKKDATLNIQLLNNNLYFSLLKNNLSSLFHVIRPIIKIMPLTCGILELLHLLIYFRYSCLFRRKILERSKYRLSFKEKNTGRLWKKDSRPNCLHHVEKSNAANQPNFPRWRSSPGVAELGTRSSCGAVSAALALSPPAGHAGKQHSTNVLGNRRISNSSDSVLTPSYFHGPLIKSFCYFFTVKIEITITDEISELKKKKKINENSAKYLITEAF